MSQSGKRRSRHRQLQASHQKNWLTGHYAVLETLRAGRWPIQDLFLSEALDEAVAEEIESLAEATDCGVHVATPERLEELCSSQHHQGIVARMRPYPYGDLTDLFQHLTGAPVSSESKQPLVVVCDRIQDVFNFGAILRCCDAMGADAVIIADNGQTGVTPQVARSSSGAVNFVNVIQTDDLKQTCQQLREHGLALAAASEKSDGVSWGQNLNSAIALIVGSEAYGVSPELLDLCDVRLRIPMMGRVTSLNAAVAAGVLLYEIRRQQCSG